MALPELTLPPGFPAFRANGHAIELTPMYADSPMRTGHDRKRRVYTTVPRIVSVGLLLSAEHTRAFHEWYEGSLQAGTMEFSAQVANQGPGLLWWRARFLETYTADAIPGNGYFDITAKLLLVGEGTTTAPYVPAMQASAQIALSGSAALTVPADLAAAVSIALQSAVFLNAAVTVMLTSIQDGATPSAVDFEKRWMWMRYPYAAGRTADVTDSSEFDQRSWMGI